SEPVLVMEANLDDMNPEVLPYALEQLIVAGAQDAWVTPVLMKKGRPGFVLAAMFRAENHDRVADVFFRETTTLGVRVHDANKLALTREWVEIHIEDHPLRVKLARRGGAVVTASPEHEDALKVARATGIPLRDVYARAQATVQAMDIINPGAREQPSRSD
ncbi:MAG: nickel insertion protein, partial [Actinomycetota bacterium]